MIAFAVAALVLLLLALAIVLRPLLRTGAAAGVARERSNLDIYRHQLEELETDLKSGALSAGQAEQARLDLERRVLEEAATTQEAPASTAGRSLAVPVTLGALIPIAAVLLYLHLGNLEGLTAVPHAASGAGSVSAEQFQDMTAKLAERLKSNPNDPVGWTMLGRAYRVLERHQDAANAFRKAAALKPDDAELLADYAEALALAQGRKLEGEPTKLLERALKLDPNSEKALALSGSAAFERKDYKAAIRHWEALLKHSNVSGDLVQALQTGIAEARALSEGRTPVAVRAAGRVSGTVSLDASLQGRVDPEDAVFVFARAAQGPRMPLAIAKVKVRDLPYDFALDDSMAMTPEMKISGFAEIVIGARVSKSGKAMPASGDLEGVSATVKPGASGVQVSVNQVVK